MFCSDCGSSLSHVAFSCSPRRQQTPLLWHKLTMCLTRAALRSRWNTTRSVGSSLSGSTVRVSSVCARWLALAVFTANIVVVSLMKGSSCHFGHSCVVQFTQEDKNKEPSLIRNVTSNTAVYLFICCL